MRLKDKELEKAICYKIGKFRDEELNEEDLAKVEEINISNRSFSGEAKNISLNELSLLPHIKTISLQYFEIDDSLAEIINSLQELNTLQLASCKYKAQKSLDNKSLRSLSLNCCDISDYNKIVAPEILTVIGEDKLKLDKISGKENVRRMYIQASEVKGFGAIRDYANLKSLSLEGAKIDDTKALDEMKDKIEVNQKEKYTPMR